MTELLTQFVNLLGAALLILAFAMISQRRILSLIHLFTLQGAALVVATATLGYVTQQPHLYLSAAITFVLKVLLIPYLLHRVIERLNVRWDVETLIEVARRLQPHRQAIGEDPVREFARLDLAPHRREQDLRQQRHRALPQQVARPFVVGT